MKFKAEFAFDWEGANAGAFGLNVWRLTELCGILLMLDWIQDKQILWIVSSLLPIL